MPLRILDEAKRDARIARRRRESVETRQRLNRELRACYTAISKSPSSDARHPDADDPLVRFVLLRSLPYVVLYYDDPAETLVLGVIDARSGPATIAKVLARR